MTEFRPSSFQILPTIIKNIIIINVLVYVAQITIGKSPGFPMEDLFALHTWQSPLFKPWQFVTYLFMHDPSNISHIFFNMFALWMFGATLENLWGPKRFLLFYFACGLGAAFCHMLVLYFENQGMINMYNYIRNSGDMNEMYYFIKRYGGGYLGSPDEIFVTRINEATLGASGAVFGCLAAFGYLFPNSYMYVYFLIPVKVKWFVLLYIGSELFATVKSSAGDNVAHIAHLGGALVGFLLVYFWNKTNRRMFY